MSSVQLPSHEKLKERRRVPSGDQIAKAKESAASAVCRYRVRPAASLMNRGARRVGVPSAASWVQTIETSGNTAA